MTTTHPKWIRSGLTRSFVHQGINCQGVWFEKFTTGSQIYLVNFGWLVAHLTQFHFARLTGGGGGKVIGAGGAGLAGKREPSHPAETHRRGGTALRMFMGITVENGVGR